MAAPHWMPSQPSVAYALQARPGLLVRAAPSLLVRARHRLLVQARSSLLARARSSLLWPLLSRARPRQLPARRRAAPAPPPAARQAASPPPAAARPARPARSRRAAARPARRARPAAPEPCPAQGVLRLRRPAGVRALRPRELIRGRQRRVGALPGWQLVQRGRHVRAVPRAPKLAGRGSLHALPCWSECALGGPMHRLRSAARQRV